jgi:DeoR/GlpR family transcriptional regulator of sugar metabolism
MSGETSFDNGTTRSLSRQRRQERITRSVLAQGSVTVEGLMSELGVSRMTVHRDLDELETEGILRKVRGGATAERSSRFESDVQYRLRSALREKEAIAEAAAGLVELGQSVFLDESTTVLPLARRLAAAQGFTIITNFEPVIERFGTARGTRLIGLGGEYHPRYASFYGIHCERMIASLRADVAFISPSAIEGLVAYNQDELVVTTKRAMMAAATRRVLLADHTKIDRAALHKLGEVTEFDHLVTDDGIAPAALEALRDAGIDVRIATVS